MRVRLAALQFAPKLGRVEENMARADALLRDFRPGPGAGAAAAANAPPTVLILPELCFTGYNFASPAAIEPFLEDRVGPSAKWAAATARRLGVHVVLGFPERGTDGKTYNAATMHDPQGREAMYYRKTHMFTADRVWGCEASEGGMAAAPAGAALGDATVQLGICMDLNPAEFVAPFNNLEFARSVVANKARLAIVPMAWAEDEPPELRGDTPTLADYWLARFPLKVPAVFANRVGIEDDVEYGGMTTIWDGEKAVSLGPTEEAVLEAEVELPGEDFAAEILRLR